jgi:7-cyano-7-deazaguanosine (preQ0) biosynthesis protein QueE
MFINEIFGPTIQGEGKSLNKSVLFIRLSGCNLACSFCDTPYTWNWVGTPFVHPDKYEPKKETHAMSTKEIVDKLLELDSTIQSVVISGGEPLLQQKSLIELFRVLKQLGYWIEVESNGTVKPEEEFLSLVDQINCSPKLASSGPDNIITKRRNKDSLLRLANSEKVYFKFVVTDAEDLKEINELVSEYKISPSRVYLMPEGYTRQKQLEHQQKVLELCLYHGYNFSPRMHVLIYDKKRGV